jgi:hypothetical protein
LRHSGQKRKGPQVAATVGLLLGRSDRIRTYDPRLPKAVLYQAELHSDAKRAEL